MQGLLYILLCWLAGNALSAAIGGYVSGNIIGMVLMFAALTLRVFDPEKVRPAAKFLLGTMALFFVPYGVGLMTSYTAIMENLWAILLAALLSTAVVIAVAGWSFQAVKRRTMSNPEKATDND